MPATSGVGAFLHISTQEACNDFNNKMLQSLSNSVKEIPCCDLVDESGSMRKWNKKCGSRQRKLTGRNVIDEPDSKKQENPCENFKQDLA